MWIIFPLLQTIFVGESSWNDRKLCSDQWNGKNSIPRSKFCLKSFNQTILNGAQKMILMHISKSQSNGKLNGPNKIFSILDNWNYCSENAVGTCRFNLHPACKSHSSPPSQLKKRPDPKMLFFMHTSILFIPVLQRLPFTCVPGTYCRYMYMHLRNEAPNILFILKWTETLMLSSWASSLWYSVNTTRTASQQLWCKKKKVYLRMIIIG